MILDDLARIARHVTGDFRFERTYSSVVERVSDDTVDVLPDDAAVRGRGLQRVPMPTIDPTTQLRPVPGCRCLLGFTEGNPQRPVIVAWEFAQGSAVVQLDGGTAAVARKGDLVDVFVTPGGVPVSGIAYLPAPTPFTGVATITGQVRAAIVGGAARVKA